MTCETVNEKPNVLLLGSIPVDKITSLKNVIDSFNREFNPVYCEELSEKAAMNLIGEAEAVVLPWTASMILSSEVLEKAGKLKLIMATYGGIKRNVAAGAALDRGIRLSCTGPARARSVAEFTMGLTLSALLHIPRINHAMRGGQSFPRYGYTRELTGKTVGIVGFGAVSREVMKLLRPYDVRIMVQSNHGGEEEIAHYGGEKVELSYLLMESEIVMVLTGLTEKTQGLLGERELGLIRDGGLVVNSSRGKIIQEKVLIKELEKGRITAALDVYEEEPLSLDSPLRRLENAVITAHSANSTIEMDSGRWEFALEELRLFFSEASLKGEILPEHLKYMSDD